MRPMNQGSCRVALVAGLLLISSLAGAACSTPAPEQAPAATGVTMFEGARLIVGDDSAPIENAAFIVDNGRFGQIGNTIECTEVGIRAVEFSLPIDAGKFMSTDRDCLHTVG